MQLYKIGKIVSITKSSIILESNYIGQIYYVAQPSAWEQFKDSIHKVYVYNYQSEYTTASYAFESFSERVLFEDLIGVNGIGPRTALGLLREGVEIVSQLIAEGSVERLTQLPQIGVKSAHQIIFDLKAKYESFLASRANGSKMLPLDIKHSLKNLGFNAKQIEYAIENIKPEKTIELMIENAIKVIANAKFS